MLSARELAKLTKEANDNKEREQRSFINKETERCTKWLVDLYTQKAKEIQQAAMKGYSGYQLASLAEAKDKGCWENDGSQTGWSTAGPIGSRVEKQWSHQGTTLHGTTIHWK